MPSFRLARLVCSLALPAALAAVAAHAQAGHVYTDADYTRAANQLSWVTTPLVDHVVRSAQFLDHDRFWYVETTAGNNAVMLGDAAKGTRREAFDAARMATALQAAGAKVHAGKYVPDAFNLSDEDKTARISVQEHTYKCNLTTYTCATELPGSTGLTRGGRRSAPMAVLSPDGKKAAFIRDWNLWVRDTATNAETQLTTDGVKDFGYATDNAGWTHSDRAVVLWSPDSRKIATFQQDQRLTGEMYTVTTNVGHPKLEAWKYPLVGDEHVTMIERVILDVDTPGKVLRLQLPPDQHRSTLCDDVSCHGGWDDVQWATNAKTLAFVSTSRDHKDETVRIADATTGKVRDVFSEHAATFFESGYDAVNWRYLSDRNEILWFSQRSNWGNLYLYDATTGKLKHAVTHGDWNVADILYLDQNNGDMLITGMGREPGEDPYYRKVYSTNLDGKNLKLLSPEDAMHQATVSSDGRFLVDTYSTPHSAPITVLRDRTGKVVEELAHGDLSRLVAAGWIAPETFHVTAHDGKTQVYGLLFKPANLDASQKYPIINYIYPGPQGGSFGSHSFLPSRGDSNALAQLGFAVVEIEGMGNPQRSKSFHDTYLNDIGINAVPDQISGMKELATRYPWIDMERTGMWGHSGGGNATGAMMFRYPGFIKVAISESGNHENRNYEDDWDEKWVGLSHKNADGTTNYDAQANAQYAKNLTGKLMLAHGLLDDNVPLSNTMLVVEALEKANKDFDLVVFPHAHHGYADMSLYMMRRRWDYFVNNLMKGTAPHEFKMPAPPTPGQ